MSYALPTVATCVLFLDLQYNQYNFEHKTIMKNEVDICQISVRCLSDARQMPVGYVHMLVAVSMLFFLSTIFTFILGMMAQIGEHRNGMTSGTTTDETYGSLSVRQMKQMEI